jgi:tRNA threonylcarbamoyladenosine biosynthesis protein TsaE
MGALIASMDSWVYIANDLAQTDALGARLAGLLAPGGLLSPGNLLPTGRVVALDGPLGAGKTRLVRAIAAALGVDPAQVTSPTFVLVNEYHGHLPIYHFDAYRLRDDDEFLELGPDEYFEGQGLSLVEWAGRVKRCLPAERLEIQIEVTGPTSRRFLIRGHGPRYEAIVASLRG